PMQEGMLFHSLHDRASVAYFQQVSYHMKGELNISCVKASLNELFKRYDILRTVFDYKKKDQPLQIVLKEREVDFNYDDLRSLTSTAAKVEFVQQFKKKDKERSFDLTKDILMRVSVLQLEDNEYEFIWSHHHILMDGWCLGILVP